MTLIQVYNQEIQKYIKNIMRFTKFLEKNLQLDVNGGRRKTSQTKWRPDSPTNPSQMKIFLFTNE